MIFIHFNSINTAAILPCTLTLLGGLYSDVFFEGLSDLEYGRIIKPFKRVLMVEGAKK